MEAEKKEISDNVDIKHKKKFWSDEWHLVTVLLMLYDLFAVNMSYFFALWLRFDCRYTEIPEGYSI